MSQRGRKTHEERVCGPKPSQEQDDEYDVYLFCPTLASQDTRSSPLYGPVSLHSESTDFDYSELSSGPPSPITFAPTHNCRFPMEIDFGAVSPDAHEDEAKSPKASETAEEYSLIVKIGLVFSQMTRLLDRAIDGIKIGMGKPKS